MEGGGGGHFICGFCVVVGLVAERGATTGLAVDEQFTSDNISIAK